MIYFDLDGVLCDFVGRFLDLLWHWHGTPYCHEDVDDDIAKALARGDNEKQAQIAADLTRFLADHTALVNCLPIRAVWRVAITNLRPDDACILTARTGVALDAAHAWCEAWGVKFKIISDVKKLDHLRAGDVLIEDNSAVAETYLRRRRDGVQEGEVVLIEQPWNRYHAFTGKTRRLSPSFVVSVALAVHKERQANYE